MLLNDCVVSICEWDCWTRFILLHCGQKTLTPKHMHTHTHTPKVKLPQGKTYVPIAPAFYSLLHIAATDIIFALFFTRRTDRNTNIHTSIENNGKSTRSPHEPKNNNKSTTMPTTSTRRIVLTIKIKCLLYANFLLRYCECTVARKKNKQ